MNFKESFEYLTSLGYERSVKKFGLENSYALFEALNNPQENYLKVQIVGTNGKGSTCAFLESILVKAGLRVGVNTSPHLVSVTERIRINGIEITETKFAEYVTRLRAVAIALVESGKLEASPTFFEHLTSMSLLIFSEANVDVAILEAGLGGRFDATSAAGAEIIGVTRIGLDHVKTLGDTIELIAAEKAAAIHKGCEVVIGKQKENALEVVTSRCDSLGIQPVIAENSIAVINEQDSNDSKRFSTSENEYESVSLSLKGDHQTENASVAILIAELIAKRGFEISIRAVKAGLESANHQGRLEFNDGFLFDGAHNLQGARALRNYLSRNVDQPIIMIFGTMGGKDIASISKELFPLAERLILTTPKINRAMAASEIAERANVTDISVCIDSPKKALEFAVKARSQYENALILVTGSLYLVGEIKAELRLRNKNIDLG